MCVVLEAMRDNASVIYQPADFNEYAAAIASSGMTPPQVSFRLRLPSRELASDDLQSIEEEVAAFFGLGQLSGIHYQVKAR